MPNKTLFLALLTMALMALPIFAESIEGLPLHVKQIEPGVVRLWVGDLVSSTAVTAIATKKGIVVIDSTELPKLDQAFRKVIARELGRNDFKYLINTHGHADHTNGNGVYADCEIVAQENVPAMMKENFGDFTRLTAWYREDTQRQKEQIASGKLNEIQKAAAQERLIIDAQSADYANSSPKPTFPTKTFNGRLVLDCGDITFELYQSGGTHTASDIFVFVPQKGLLFTGDMMADKWLTDTPGCLATFAARSGAKTDYPVLVKNWQSLLDRQAEIKQYIPGHWNGELSFEGFKARFDYLKTLLADVESLAKSGGDFVPFRAGYTLQNKFPQLVNSPGITPQGHQMSLSHLYMIFSGKIPVTNELQQLIRGNAFQSGFEQLKENVLRDGEKYFVSENELNGLGYSLMQQKRVDDAVALFEFNVKLNPDSWNAWDSLAEGWYEKGDKQKALELYRKSLELNPGNENGKKFIARIEKQLTN